MSLRVLAHLAETLLYAWWSARSVTVSDASGQWRCVQAEREGLDLFLTADEARQILGV